uniref:Vacuolar protein sorting-associated protein 28 homolog n=1 Tax=Prasinoderma coloniale TaxID=156133 RepID=A0A7R9TKW7_9VIRI|eukprot:PRCOL_00004236-RA
MSGAGHAAAPPVRLWSSKAEREHYENSADLFAIIKSAEKLEKAFQRDAVTTAEYEAACSKLIAQFKTVRSALGKSVADVESFMATYNMHCPYARQRLLVSGMPATIEHSVRAASQADNAQAAKAAAECTQFFITAMDALKMNMVAVDTVHPLLTDVVGSLNRLRLKGSFEGLEKIKQWAATLNRRSAADELSEEEVRQLLFELETAYNAFHTMLGAG